MNWILSHRALLESIGAVLVSFEQVIPYLPMRANSTAQAIINIVKALLPKKDE